MGREGAGAIVLRMRARGRLYVGLYVLYCCPTSGRYACVKRILFLADTAVSYEHEGREEELCIIYLARSWRVFFFYEVV